MSEKSDRKGILDLPEVEGVFCDPEDSARAELDKLITYAREVKGSRDVHSVYEVLDLIPQLRRENERLKAERHAISQALSEHPGVDDDGTIPGAVKAMGEAQRLRNAELSEAVEALEAFTRLAHPEDFAHAKAVVEKHRRQEQ